MYAVKTNSPIIVYSKLLVNLFVKCKKFGIDQTNQQNIEFGLVLASHKQINKSQELHCCVFSNLYPNPKFCHYCVKVNGRAATTAVAMKQNFQNFNITNVQN